MNNGIHLPCYEYLPFSLRDQSFDATLQRLCLGLVCSLLLMLKPSTLTLQILARNLTRHTHAVIPVQHDLFSGKQLIDLLERQESCLGIEEVEHGDEGKVEDAKVDVRLPADARDGDGGDLDDEEGEDPV